LNNDYLAESGLVSLYKILGHVLKFKEKEIPDFLVT